MNNKISACLVVHNEEKLIERCLESIKGVVDEIIIVHDGECRDKTIEICKKYTDKIFIKSYVGEAEVHRPFSFKQATGEWILQIDADEFLSKELKGAIKDLAKDSRVDAYEFLWPVWDGNRYVTKNWPYKLCFFRRDKFCFLGIVHFVPRVRGIIKRSRLILEHRPGYNNFTWGMFRGKWVKWSEIHAKIYLKNFKEVKKFNYPENDWPKKIQLRKKYPILLMPFEFFITFLKSVLSGGYRDGAIAYKYSFMIALYKVFVNYYIFINKIKNKYGKNI